MNTEKKLLAWAMEAQEIITESGDDSFEDLRRKDKKRIYAAFNELGLKCISDGDTDGAYEIYHSGTYDYKVSFTSCGDECWNDDYLTSLDIGFGGDEHSLTEFVIYLDGIISAGIQIINLTPHEITIFAEDGKAVITSIPSSGIARAKQVRTKMESINSIPVSHTSYGQVVGLPEAAQGVIYIVSVLTAQAAPQRKDLYIVDELVRDAEGKILGCKALAQVS